MKFVKSFNESNSSLFEEITFSTFVRWCQSHTLIEDLDEVLNLFDDKFNLYQDEPGENSFNTYRIKNKSLKIRLNKLKQEIYINSYDDEWFTISQGFFISFKSENFEEVKYFICDSIEGVKKWIDETY